MFNVFNIGAGTASVPPGTYTGSLVKVDSEKVNSAYGEKMMWRWTFLLNVNGEGRELDALTSQATSPKSKAYAFLTAILGRPPAIGESLEPPIGKQVLVSVVEKDNGFAKISGLSTYVEPQQTLPGVPR